MGNMRYLTLLIFAALLINELVIPPASTAALVQVQTSAQEKAATLRAQLIDVDTKQAELQTRLQALDEKLKPENIEHDLAGVGSTRPEDLREQRRRQLEIERNGMQRQLDLLATSRSRLLTAIANADADAYRQSAQPVTPAVVVSDNSSVSDAATVPAPQRPRRVKKKKAKKSKRVQQSQGY